MCLVQLARQVINLCRDASCLWPSYKQGVFVTTRTMEAVRDSIANTFSFMSSYTFNPWKGFAGEGRLEFVESFTVAFNSYLSRKKTCSYQHLYDSTRRSQKMQFVGECETSTATCSGNPSPSVIAVNSPGGSRQQSKSNMHLSLESLLGRKEDVEEKREERGECW